MPQPAHKRLASTLQAVVDAAIRRAERELRGLVRALESDTHTELRRLDRRVTRLEQQQQRGNSRKVAAGKASARCKREGCREPALARGLCSRHYQQMRYRSKKRRSRRR